MSHASEHRAGAGGADGGYATGKAMAEAGTYDEGARVAVGVMCVIMASATDGVMAVPTEVARAAPDTATPEAPPTVVPATGMNVE